MSGRGVRHARRVKNPVSRLCEGREMARRVRTLGDCPDCRHLWVKHTGYGNDRDGMCGECAYELEHEQRETSDPGCTRAARSLT